VNEHVQDYTRSKNKCTTYPGISNYITGLITSVVLNQTREADVNLMVTDAAVLIQTDSSAASQFCSA